MLSIKKRKNRKEWLNDRKKIHLEINQVFNQDKILVFDMRRQDGGYQMTDNGLYLP